MRAVRLAAAAMVLLSVVGLAGCGGGGGAPVTQFQTRLNQALAIVQKTHPKATLWEIDILPAGETGSAWSDVATMEFTYNRAGDPYDDTTVTLSWANGSFGDPVDQPTGLDGDVFIRDPVLVDFDAAVKRLSATGHDTAFDHCTYRHPVDTFTTEPQYIFHIPREGSFVSVGARSGKVYVGRDHENVMNRIISSTRSFVRDRYTLAQLYTVAGDVGWDGENPYVMEWNLEWNNPATTPATTLVMLATHGQPLEDPTVEQRQMTGYTEMQPDLALDPGDAIAKLQNAGYTEHFTRMGVVRAAAAPIATEPAYWFTCPVRGVVVYIGATTGALATQAISGSGGVIPPTPAIARAGGVRVPLTTSRRR